jgi:hypothetical protein
MGRVGKWLLYNVAIISNWTKTLQAVDRPLILIGHSLGGILIKQVSSTSNQISQS